MDEHLPRIRDRREVAANRFFSLVEENLVLPGGGGYTYFQLESNYDAVVVVPELDDGRLVLERIYRHPYRSCLWEFPAGGIEPGEDPCTAGGRELTEETGYVAAHTRLLGSCRVMPGLMRMSVHVVHATGLALTDQLDRDPLELIEVDLVTRAEAWARANAEASSFLVHGLLWLERARCG